VSFLVEKRDGRREWLRTTKLARSIRLALIAADAPDDLAPELAAAVVAGLRARGETTPVRTDVIAEAAVRVLVAVGWPRAASLYADVRSERGRRRVELARIGVAAPEGPWSEGPGSATVGLQKRGRGMAEGPGREG
jgi:hypothetical protein